MLLKLRQEKEELAKLKLGPQTMDPDELSRQRLQEMKDSAAAATVGGAAALGLLAAASKGQEEQRQGGPAPASSMAAAVQVCQDVTTGVWVVCVRGPAVWVWA